MKKNIQNAAVLSVAFLLFAINEFIYCNEITVENILPESATIAAESAENNAGGIKQEVVAKTQEIFDGVVTGELNAQEHARSFDSFLTATFYRIQDALELCRHELILARDAAHEEAQKAKDAVLEKLPDLPALPGTTK